MNEKIYYLLCRKRLFLGLFEQLGSLHLMFDDNFMKFQRGLAKSPGDNAL